jgi:hypothetical protein
MTSVMVSPARPKALKVALFYGVFGSAKHFNNKEGDFDNGKHWNL